MVEARTDLTEMGWLTVEATAKSRANLALHHLYAACRFAARIGEIERQNASEPFGSFWEEIFQNSLGVATLSTACVECYANELFFDARKIVPALSPPGAELVAELLDARPTLDKFSAVLVLRGGPRLAAGVQAVQDIGALIRLRNEVVHFKPEWLEEQVRHEKLSKVLRYKFKPSPFLPNEPMFPRAWASHGFAVWAVRSVVLFLEHFYAQVGLDCPVSQRKGRLSELLGHAI